MNVVCMFFISFVFTAHLESPECFILEESPQIYWFAFAHAVCCVNVCLCVFVHYGLFLSYLQFTFRDVSALFIGSHSLTSEESWSSSSIVQSSTRIHLWLLDSLVIPYLWYKPEQSESLSFLVPVSASAISARSTQVSEADCFEHCDLV